MVNDQKPCASVGGSSSLLRAISSGKSWRKSARGVFSWHNALRGDASGAQAALYLARMLIWVRDGEDGGAIEKPPEAAQHEGHGVPLDHTQAAFWYQKAA